MNRTGEMLRQNPNAAALGKEQGRVGALAAQQEGGGLQCEIGRRRAAAGETRGQAANGSIPASHEPRRWLQ